MTEDRNKIDQIFRDRQDQAAKYSLDNPGNRFNHELLCSQIKSSLHSTFENLAAVKILDLGAGELSWLEHFTHMGLDHKNCFGSDLLLWRMQAGRKADRKFNAVAASAADLPFADESVDLVTQFVLMTSVTDLETRREVVAEMKRVLRPGGYILWHDFRFNNPSNPHTKAIGKGEIYRYFDGWPIVCRTTTLLPPLARKLGGKLTPLLKLFYSLPILRTHYLALIGPKG